MAITRADIAGALKLIHANSLTNRRGHLHNMISAEHEPHHVAKIMSDLHTYEGWDENKHLDSEPRPEPKRRAKK
jgi:hypothetical protein